MPQAAPVAFPLLLTPALGQLLDLALEEDTGRGDVTTAALSLTGEAVGTVICREAIVCCGLPLAPWLLGRVSPRLKSEPLAAEGEVLAPGAALLHLAGPAAELLRAERTLLNFLMRTCGVATLTRRYTEAVAGTAARVVDTRKTLPGWRLLDKYAVRVGGGANHRFDLGSGLLIKDNHIAASGSPAEAVRLARAQAPHPLRIEVEVESLAAAREALAAGAEVLLLDNMSPAQVAEVVAALGAQVLLEVSGGVTLQSIRAYAEAGAALISVGALTHSAPAVDLSLELEAS